MGQLLAAPRPTSIEQVVSGLGEVQMDPTSVVARTEHLVLFSRLGPRFDVAELERLLWHERALFEYWVHIVPIEDLPMHRISMRRYPHGDQKHRRLAREWLTEDRDFVRYVLAELRRRGPLLARDLENRASERWRTGGWTGQSAAVPELLDILWGQGRVMIVGRQGQQRLWDVASRSLPSLPKRPSSALASDLVDRQLRARGLERLERLGTLFDGEMPGHGRAIEGHLRDGLIVPVEVEGLPGRWVAHRDLLDTRFRGRTVALSPFDDLVSDRDRTERLFDMRFRLEIYTPKVKREFGYFVLPVLNGDRLVGRIDPAFDRREHVLRINAIHMQPGTTGSDREAVGRAIEEMGRWLGARRVELDPPTPTGTRPTPRA